MQAEWWKIYFYKQRKLQNLNLSSCLRLQFHILERLSISCLWWSFRVLNRQNASDHPSLCMLVIWTHINKQWCGFNSELLSMILVATGVNNPKWERKKSLVILRGTFPHMTSKVARTDGSGEIFYFKMPQLFCRRIAMDLQLFISITMCMCIFSGS